METKFTEIGFEQLVKLYCAGAGQFHFHNKVTGNTFSVAFKPDNNGILGVFGWKVSESSVILASLTTSTNPNKNIPIARIGVYNFNSNTTEFKCTPDQDSVDFFKLCESFEYIDSHIITRDPLPEKFAVLTPNICARCGKTITDPSSIQKGFGPECEKYYQKRIKNFQLKLF
jgi:hypothetical protein